ncbi:hypothetical protein MJ585_28625 [Klebsiella pneumoniae]|nr:hypothetical protein MJ585_28625 [Klebsiella pneumoniae]
MTKAIIKHEILTLEVENFMALANAKVELDSGRGLVLIQGVMPGTHRPPAMALVINPHE